MTDQLETLINNREWFEDPKEGRLIDGLVTYRCKEVGRGPWRGTLTIVRDLPSGMKGFQLLVPDWDVEMSVANKTSAFKYARKPELLKELGATVPAKESDDPLECVDCGKNAAAGGSSIGGAIRCTECTAKLEERDEQVAPVLVRYMSTQGLRWKIIQGDPPEVLADNFLAPSAAGEWCRDNNVVLAKTPRVEEE